MSETLAAEAAATGRIDEEDIRLTTGFADIFTALVLIVGGAGLAAATGAFGCLLLVAAAFALGKPIVRVRAFAAAALAPAVIGAFLLVLAAGWTRLRRAVLWPLPERLRRFVPPAAEREPRPSEPQNLPAAEKEPVRLVLGFNDIFVSAGSTMMFIGCAALAYFLTRSRIEAEADGLRLFLSPVRLIWVGLPALSLWLVAEYFVRVRRMAWPAITTAVWFSLTSWVAGYLAAVAYAMRATPLGATLRTLPGPRDMPPNVQSTLVAIFCAVAVAANLAFWRRHRTPISFALAVVSLLPLLFADRLLSGEALAPADVALRLVPAGLVVFGLAMGWDLADRERRTQRSDVAFWLHLLAALLVIPPLFALAVDTPLGALLVIGGFLFLIVLAVAIDRRAPLVVALPLVMGPLGGSPLPSVVISLVLLALVLRWDRVRGWLLAIAAPRASA